MSKQAIIVLVGLAACGGSEVGKVNQELVSCNSRDDCPAPPGRCEEVDFCEFNCFTRDVPDCVCAASSDCDDGNACTQDVCSGGSCAHTPIPDGPGCCAVASDCPPRNACQFEFNPYCAQSSCSYFSNGNPGCCNTDEDCGGAACVNNTCSGAAPMADLALTGTGSPEIASIGEAITYTLTLHNAGPDAATGVVLTDNLPLGATLVSATPPCGGTGPVTCAIGTVAVNADVTITIVVTVSGPGIVHNQAAVASDQDPTTGNNLATTPTTVMPGSVCEQGECGPGPECDPCPEPLTCGEDRRCHGGADLGVSWATSPANVRSGEVLRFTLTVRNNGPDAATQVVVTATFSPVLPSFPEGFECVDTESEIICTIPTLAAGTSEILVFDTYYVGGLYTASASVSTQTPDPDPDNNREAASHNNFSSSGCSDCGSCDIGGGARVPGGLIWGAMVVLALRRRRRR